MKCEIEKRLSEFFLIQKKYDGMQLPAFELVVGKAAIHSTPWKLKLLLRVAAILLVIAIPIYFIMKHKTDKRETIEIVKGGQSLWPTKMQSDYFLVSTTYLWNWKAPTDALLPGKNSRGEILIRDTEDKE